MMSSEDGDRNYSIATSSKDDGYVEITLDVPDDSIALHTVKAATNGGDLQEDPELPLLARRLEKIRTKSMVVRYPSSKSRPVRHELKKLASFKRLARLNRTLSGAGHALAGLKFISKNEVGLGWEAVEKRFDDITASNNGTLPRSRFGKCIGMKSKDSAEQLFDALARKPNIRGDSIDKAYLKEFWDQIWNQSFDARLRMFLDMVDKDADGRITHEEVQEIISLCASANELSNIRERAEEYAALIMEELDPDHLGYITVDNLEMLLLQAPNQSTRGESRELSQMLSQKLKPTYDNSPVGRFCRDTKYFFQYNWQRAWVMALWIAVMSGLFAYKFIEYRGREDVYEVMGTCVCLAKGAAETLKLNMALILLPVCRNTLTWLRNKTRLGVVVPFDDNLYFHKVIAVGIVIGVGIHGISQLACDFPTLLHAKSDQYELMKQYFGEQAKSYWHFVQRIEGTTGLLMVILMAIAFTLAAPCFRRGRMNIQKPFNELTSFNAFWYSHLLFVIVYTLLIVHGIKLFLTKKWYKKTTWMYLAVPVIIYASERLSRFLRSSIKIVTIQKVAVYPGNVLTLDMSRPHGFGYISGQYMFVNCPAVSPFQWYPFSITSAPDDDYLSVHIKTLDDWTRQLRTVFSEECQQPTDCMQGTKIPEVLIDGPYGEPSRDYKKYEVVLLVGLGIGATPMISIVKDIVNNIRAMEEEEGGDHSTGSALENGNGVVGINKTSSLSPNSKKKENFKTRRAYFHWVTNQGSFDWVKGIMNEVAEVDHNHVIELHNYCTSVYEEDYPRSALITMLQSLHDAKNGVDMFSGTRVKSHFAKPNWRSVYKQIAVNHNDSRVGVFYCGAPTLTKKLRQLASDFSHKTSTEFDFHKGDFYSLQYKEKFYGMRNTRTARYCPERRKAKVKMELIFAVLNFLMETPSLVFEQLSSVHKPRYALITMLFSFTALMISVSHLVYTAGKEKFIWRRRSGRLPWFYHLSTGKPFHSYPALMGLICGLVQFISSAIPYGFYLHHKDYPLKVSFLQFVSATGLLSANVKEYLDDDDDDDDQNSHVRED